MKSSQLKTAFILSSSLTLLTSIQVFAQTYSGGSGTLGDPYQIANLTDLGYLTEHNTDWNKHFIQTADLAFADADFQSGGDFYNAGEGFNPIGDETTFFTGSYNGQGYTVDNMQINRPAKSNLGFFGYLDQATITNLGITSGNVIGNFNVGGLIGYTVLSTFQSCSFTGSVSGYQGIGGFCGGSTLDNIEKCYSKGSVSGTDYIGGLIGTQLGTNVTESFSSCHVSASGNYTGGLIGQIEDFFSTSPEITNCYAAGNVSGIQWVGGLFGEALNATVNNCYSKGEVQGFGKAFCGGRGAGTGFYTANFFDTETSGQSAIDDTGTGKTTAEMKTQGTFTDAGWDFVGEAANGTDDIWKMDLGCTNDGYPIFAWQATAVRPTITATTPASRCGTGEITLGATSSAGTVEWFSAATGGTSGYTGNTIDFNLSSTKTFYAAALENGCFSFPRTAVKATIDFCTKVQDAQCGTTLATAATAIIADAALGATHYRFEIDGGAHVITKTSRTLYLANFPFAYGTTYAIRVAASTDGSTFSAYGASCNITTPALPSTQVQASQCGTTLATNSTAIVADAVTSATHYRFQINGGTTITKTTRTLYLANFTYAFGATYAIRVAVSLDGTNFGAYSATCNVTAPAAPTMQVQASQCGTTLATTSTAIIADAVSGATHYRFEINGGAQVITKTTRTLYLGNFTYSLGTTYAIRVSYSLDGTNFQPYGASCNITSPGSAIKVDESINEMTQDLITDVSIEAYPNPNDGYFTISSTHSGKFNILNELGQLIQEVEITDEKNNTIEVDNLENGVYFITGTINGNVITKKVMVIR